EDKDKTKGQLIKDLDKLRRQISELKSPEARRNQTLQMSGDEQEKHRAIIETALDGFCLINSAGKILEVNESYCRMVGYTQEELLEMFVKDLDVKENSDEAIHHNKKKLDKGFDRFETQHSCKDGRIIDVEVSISKSYTNKDEQFVFLHDITQRKRVEEHITEEKNKLEAIISSLGWGIFIVDRDYNITYLNSFFKDLYGDKVGGKCYDVFSLEGGDHHDCPVQEAFSTGEITSIERGAVLPDGQNMFFERIASPIRDASGKISSCVEMIKDITERKIVEEALRESEEKFRLMFNSVSEGILVLDLKGFVLDANNKFLKLHGFKSKAEIIGKNSLDYVASEDHHKILEAVKEPLSSGVAASIEATIIRKDGSRFSGEISTSAMNNASGKPAGLISILRDVTERNILEQERQEMDRLESIGTLAGGIAHDFNNILTGILGNISLAQRYLEPESKALERLIEAEKASLRAKSLTTRLLTFARGGDPVKKVVSIAELIKESTAFALRGSNVKCSYSLPDDLWPLEVDEGQISQVITNIVINAGYAMPDGGLLNIAASNTTIKKKDILPLPKGKYILITIEDNGCGISLENIKKIFEPYFSTKQHSSGLGLTTTYSIVKSHNGYTMVESELGAGTTFYIYLPASVKAVIQKEEVLEETPLIGKGRILVMDDEETINLLLDKILSDAGYDVTTTKDGAEAIKVYTEAKKSGQPFDAVIMDLTIPGGMGGKEAIKKLLEIDPDVKAIVSSGYSTDPIMANFREYGFSGVVAKPYKTREIEKTLHSILAG
ncbi:MAG: PAS domain S-box protein, partial [Chloroflexota bacterium]